MMAHTPLFRLLQQGIGQAQAVHLAPAQAPDRGDLSCLSRRQLLRCSTLAMAGAIAQAIPPACRPVPWSDERLPRASIAIVGGGLAGLNAAYQLQKMGLRATVYEAKSRVGGRIQSRQGLVMPGLVNDLGAAFINSDHSDILALIQELGLELFDRRTLTEHLPFPEVAFYFQGRRIQELEMVTALAPLAKQIGRDGARLAADFDRYAPTLDACSVADYLTLHQAKINQGYVRSLIEASIRTEYGVEADQASALQLLYNLPQIGHHHVAILEADELFIVKGGTERLPQALASRLGDQVLMGWRLQGLTQEGQGFQLRFNQGIVAADYVILALPFPALRRIDLSVDLPKGLRQFIQEGGPGRNEKLFAGFTQRPWLQAEGFTGAAWSDLGYSGVWDDTQRQPEQTEGVLTFFMGGLEAEQGKGAIATQGQQFIDQLSPYLDGLQASASQRYARTAWGQDPDFGGGYTNFKPGQYTRFKDFLYRESKDPNQQRVVRVGHLLFAGEQFSEDYFGYMNGAAQTARLAAGVIYQQVLAQTE